MKNTRAWTCCVERHTYPNSDVCTNCGCPDLSRMDSEYNFSEKNAIPPETKTLSGACLSGVCVHGDATRSSEEILSSARIFGCCMLALMVILVVALAFGTHYHVLTR